MEQEDKCEASGKAAGLFALPSQTGILFVLLVLAIIVASIYDPLNPTTELSISRQVQEALDASSLPDLKWGDLDPDYTVSWGFATLGLILKFLLFPLVLVLSTVFLFLKPRRLFHSYNMEDIDSRYPDLSARFGSLAEKMGITRVPRLLWSPNRSSEAFVFGTFGNHKVCLTEGIIRHFQDRQDELDAVLTHELGHVKNRDVTRTEVAEALVKGFFWLWVSILALQVIGYVVTVVLLGSEDVAWDYSFLISFIYVFILYLLLNAMCRVRQSYADVRTVDLGRHESLDRAISSLAIVYSVPSGAFLGVRSLAFSVAGTIRANVSFARRTIMMIGPEPGFWERRAAILDPRKLLQPKLVISFATGFIIYRLCLSLPLPDYFQATIASTGILVLLALTLVPHFLQETKKTRKTVFPIAVRMVLPQVLACTVGIFAGGMIGLYTQRLANSITGLPTSTLEGWGEIRGDEPLSLLLVGFDASHQLVESLWYLIGLSATLTLLLWIFKRMSRSYYTPRLPWSWPVSHTLTKLSMMIVILALIAAYSLPAVAMAGGGFNMGVADTYFNANGDIEGAITEASRAVEWNRDSAMTWFSLGYYKLLSGLVLFSADGGREECHDDHCVDHLQKVTHSLSRAIDIDPNYSVAYANRGIANYFLGDLEKAIDDYNRAIEINPDGLTYVSRGAAYDRLGEYEKAITDFGKAIEFGEEDTYIFITRGLAHFELGEYEKAIADYDRAIEINPDFAGAYGARGLAHFELGEQEKAIADYDRAIEINPDSAITYSNRAAAYGYLAEYEKSFDDCNRAIEIDPEYAEAYYNRGIVYSNLGEYEKAIADYDRAIEIDPEYAEAYDNRGISYGLVGEQEKAIADYDRAIEINPDFAGTYYNRGGNYSDLGEYEKAIADYDRAIEINPEFTDAYYNRGLVYSRMGEHEKAIYDYDRATDTLPNFFDLYYNRGLDYYHLGEYEKAIADFDRAIEINPENVDAYLNRGTVYFNLGEYEKAIADYDRTIEIDPEYADAYYGRGHVYSNLAEHDKAFADYWKAIELDPENTDYYMGRGLAYFGLGEYAKAIADCDRAIEVNPSFADAYGLRGLSNSSLGEYKKAIADYNRAIEINPEDAMLYVGRGDVYRNLGEDEKSIADFLKATEIDPALLNILQQAKELNFSNL